MGIECNRHCVRLQAFVWNIFTDLGCLEILKQRFDAFLKLGYPRFWDNTEGARKRRTTRRQFFSLCKLKSSNLKRSQEFFPSLI